MISNEAMRIVQEVHATADIKEVAAKLNTGEWIAIAATEAGADSYLFVLGKVKKCKYTADGIKDAG